MLDNTNSAEGGGNGGLTPLCRVIETPAKSSNSEGVGIAEDEEAE